MRLGQIVHRAGIVVGGTAVTLGTIGTVVSMGPFDRLPAQTVMPKNSIELKFPSNEAFYYVPGRGANIRDKNGKLEGGNALEQTKLLADILEMPVVLISLSNHTGFFKVVEEVKGVFHRLIGTYNLDTAKKLVKYILEDIKNGQELYPIFHSAGGFPGLAALKIVADKLTSDEQKQLINPIFAGSPVAFEDINRLTELGFNVTNLINTADEIPNCVGKGGTRLKAWKYALGIGNSQGLTLRKCTTLFRQQYSSQEIKKDHELESYLPAIKEAVESNK